MLKVSVVVPVYNAAAYLEQCLDSLVSQTLREMEILCVDDGSTDETPSVLQRYARQDARIVVLTQPNRGMGAAYNAGMARARGAYIGFVESDDFAEPDMFETLYAAATENGAAVVKSDCFLFGGGKERRSPTFELAGPESGFIRPLDFPDAFFSQRVWSGLYKRDFLEKNAIRYNETPGASFQDVSFNFLVMACAPRFYYLRRALLHYRTDNPLSSFHSRDKTFALMDECACIEDYLRRHAADPRLWEMLANLRFRLYRREACLRVDEAQAPAFLARAAEEYLRDRDEGRHARALWSEGDWDELQRILADPAAYLEGVRRLIDEREEKRSAFVRMLRENGAIYLYGAGGVAHRLLYALSACGVRCEGFALPDGESEALEPALPLCRVAELEKRPDALLLIAVREPSRWDLRPRMTDTRIRYARIGPDGIDVLLRRLGRALP